MFTVSYIDGQIHPGERQYIQRYVDSLAWNGDDKRAVQLRDLLHQAEAEVVTIAFAGAEATGPLSTRALEAFRALAVHDQATALELITGLLHADGAVTVLEEQLYNQLRQSFVTPPVTRSPNMNGCAKTPPSIGTKNPTARASGPSPAMTMFSPSTGTFRRSPPSPPS